MTLHVSIALLIAAVITLVFVIALPFVLGAIAHKRLRVGWKYFWFGMLVFLVFQLLTRIPLVTLLQSTLLAPVLRTSGVFSWVWLAVSALTAALFEEVGRYLGYRILMGREEKTWSKAIMFGLGHEGLESIVLVGGQILIYFLVIALLSTININHVPIAQRQGDIQQIAFINGLPFWYPLQSAWGRLWSFPLQVSLSVIVLQVFRRQQVRWLWLAIAFHTLVDFTTAAVTQIPGATALIALLINGILLCLFGLIGLWIIWRLRDLNEGTRVEGVRAEPSSP
jgi:uncharacterized membrane protein YhfC